jgi:hypothetical protein
MQSKFLVEPHLFQNYDAVNCPEDELEKPEFSDLESDLEEELEVENWDEWEGQGSQHEQEDDDDKGLPERISFNSFLSFDLEKMLLKNS